MNDSTMQKITCFDMWVLSVLLWFSTPYIYFTPNTETTLQTGAIYGGGIISLIITSIFLVLCSRLKKYRYLCIYDNCQKVTSKSKIMLFILTVVVGILMFVTIPETITMIPYLSLCVLLSVRFLDSEEQI